MGLCKCPKRRVTNQFCFEHRVNVCEHCMVTNHPKCIVQSYLQWLQDSEYSPVCELCSKDLVSEECVRLICYHVFHWSCLDRHARSLPATTAPAGYACPACRACIFPRANLVSAVADVLAQRLAGVNWARAGLGLPLLSEEREPSAQPPREPTVQPAPAAPGPLMHSVVHVDDGTFNRADLPVQAPRRAVRPASPVHVSARPRDHDDDKYKRRSAAELVGRWSKSWLGGARGRTTPRRRWVVALAALTALALLVALFSWAGARATRDDPSFDPHHNPNVRIAEMPA